MAARIVNENGLDGTAAQPVKWAVNFRL